MGISADDIAKAYGVLGIYPGASLQDAKEAWKTLSKVWHPDTHTPGSAEHREAMEKQKEINQAYDVIKRAGLENMLPPPKKEGSATTSGEYKNAPGALDAQYEKAKQDEKNGTDLLEVMYTYKKLAQLGHVKAQFKTGLFYFDSVMKDLAQAHYWWNRAAEQGHVVAQYNLGLMYERGLGVEMDAEKAHHWFQESAKLGDAKAKAKLASMAPKQTTADLVAQALSQQKAAAKPETPPPTGPLGKTAGASGEQAGRSFLSKKQKVS